MRFLFFVTVVSCLGFVGYHLVQIDPIPVAADQIDFSSAVASKSERAFALSPPAPPIAPVPAQASELATEAASAKINQSKDLIVVSLDPTAERAVSQATTGSQVLGKPSAASEASEPWLAQHISYAWSTIRGFVGASPQPAQSSGSQPAGPDVQDGAVLAARPQTNDRLSQLKVVSLQQAVRAGQLDRRRVNGATRDGRPSARDGGTQQARAAAAADISGKPEDGRLVKSDREAGNSDRALPDVEPIATAGGAPIVGTGQLAATPPLALPLGVSTNDEELPSGPEVFQTGSLVAGVPLPVRAARQVSLRSQAQFAALSDLRAPSSTISREVRGERSTVKRAMRQTQAVRSVSNKSAAAKKTVRAKASTTGKSARKAKSKRRKANRRLASKRASKRSSKRSAKRRGRGRGPLFRYGRRCSSYGCRRVVYARRPVTRSEARRVRRMRARVAARQRRLRAYYRYR
ncbi:MAG: hypothetical protein AAGG72_03405 [Pseudomonadota bacterium]